MAWQRGKVEGRKSSGVMTKSKHLHPHSGSSRTCSSFFKKNIYLLIFGQAESSLLHSGFSLVATSGGYSLIVVHRLLLVASSLVGEHRLSYPKACEIFPGRGLNPCPALRDGFLATGLPGKPGPAPIHLALLAAPHDYSLWPHCSRLFPSLGLSSSIDRPIYILVLLQVQVKAQPQDAFQDISSLTPFFMRSDSRVHSSIL